MLKIILGVTSAIFSCLCAGYFAYLYISGMDEGHSPMLLVPSAFLIGIGVYALFKVIKIIQSSKNVNAVDALALEGVPASGGDSGKILQRNNKLIQDYTKTEKTQDQLKMLQAAGAVEEGN